ncbi:hypothetical protein PInf_017716 [Phytophthora infestans]|nr:hypothetical protein PInf_017716 [Phytophthora infestans]
MAQSFSRYMKRDRFTMITRYLHFASNNAADASKDKAWKVRPELQPSKGNPQSDLLAKAFPELNAVSCMHSKPVAMIVTGCATTMASVRRRVRVRVFVQTYRVPSWLPIISYWYGKVYQHDQLRLQ